MKFWLLLLPSLLACSAAGPGGPSGDAGGEGLDSSSLAPRDAAADYDYANGMNACWSCNPPWWCDEMPGWLPPDLAGRDCPDF